MQQRDKLLNHLPPGEHRQAIQIILDKAYRVLQSGRPCWTDFYEPGTFSLAIPVIKQLPDLLLKLKGGYSDAERARLILIPDWMTEECDSRISLLKIEVKRKGEKLSHRDYLGSILGLGIKRDKIGDIILTDMGCQVVVEQEMAQYIMLNLTKVGKLSVEVNEITEDQLEFSPEDKLEIVTTVPSLRLDVVLAAGFNLARGKATKLIQEEKVKLNWLLSTRIADQVKEGDLISCRGKGRIKIVQLPGKTKKGRDKVIFNKFS